jgi:SAM-dependent methyltransferase
MGTTDKVAHYNARYRKENYFGYREWVFDRYISGLIRACGLEQGATVLDVGCGQGFFSYLFRKHGMNVTGIDISEVGIQAARNAYGHLGITFAVADIETDVLPGRFDCVFVRGLSLYNRPDFPDNAEVTNNLLKLVSPSGVLLFLYHSNCSSKRSESWRYHSWKELQTHFSRYPGARFHFSFKIDASVLGRYAFSAPLTQLNLLVSKVARRGGDLICILKNPAATQAQPGAGETTT